MKNFWVGFKAFLAAPLRFVADPGNTVLDYQIKLMEAEGRSLAEIDQAVTDSGMKKGAPIVQAAEYAVDGMDFLFKHLGAVLIIVFLIVAGWYILMFRKAVA